MSISTSDPWTILVYFAGDNNLTTDMARALDDIVRSGHNPDINIYAYFDSLSRDVPTVYCDLNEQEVVNGVTVRKPTFFRSYRIRPKLIERGRLFNENSASMNNILNFVHWCVERDGSTPKRDYGMVFSGHSFGFLDWGLFKDTNSDYYMTLSKLRWLFQRITCKKAELEDLAREDQEEEKDRATHDGRRWKPWSPKELEERTTEILGRPISLLGFDSCEMGTLEIASQFHGLTETLVASAGSVPNAGWNVAQILSRWVQELGLHNQLTPEKLAIRCVEGFIKQQSGFALADKSVDMAAWNIRNLLPLEHAFEELCENLTVCFENAGPTAHHQMRRILAQVHVDCQTYLLEQHIDLGDFCKLLFNEITLLEHEVAESKMREIKCVKAACEEVVKQIEKVILLSGFSGKERQFTHGIALFFPWSIESYWEASRDYHKLHFIREHKAGHKWRRFLEIYLGAVSRRPAITLSPLDIDGTVVITPNMQSVVYKSYSFSDIDVNGYPAVETFAEAGEFGVDRRPPDGDKRPPDGDKRPPDGDKRPPDGDKLLNNLSVFLSYFMKMKNIAARWNQTGFSANTDEVEFVSQPKKSPAAPGGPGGKVKVEIPQGRPIDRR